MDGVSASSPPIDPLGSGISSCEVNSIDAGMISSSGYDRYPPVATDDRCPVSARLKLVLCDRNSFCFPHLLNMPFPNVMLRLFIFPLTMVAEVPGIFPPAVLTKSLTETRSAASALSERRCLVWLGYRSQAPVVVVVLISGLRRSGQCGTWVLGDTAIDPPGDTDSSLKFLTSRKSLPFNATEESI